MYLLFWGQPSRTHVCREGGSGSSGQQMDRQDGCIIGPWEWLVIVNVRWVHSLLVGIHTGVSCGQEHVHTLGGMDNNRGNGTDSIRFHIKNWSHPEDPLQNDVLYTPSQPCESLVRNSKAFNIYIYTD